MQDRTFHVYILASRSRVLYTGITNNLERRVREHRFGEHGGFTNKYSVHRLVHLEPFRSERLLRAKRRSSPGAARRKWL